MTFGSPFLPIWTWPVLRSERTGHLFAPAIEPRPCPQTVRLPRLAKPVTTTLTTDERAPRRNGPAPRDRNPLPERSADAPR